jgi:hypothetical protein
VVNLDEVHPDGVNLDQRLTRARHRLIDLFVTQNFGTTCPVNADGLHEHTL